MFELELSGDVNVIKPHKFYLLNLIFISLTQIMLPISLFLFTKFENFVKMLLKHMTNFIHTDVFCLFSFIQSFTLTFIDLRALLDT